MYVRVKKIIAVFLCIVVCTAADADAYAVGNNTENIEKPEIGAQTEGNGEETRQTGTQPEGTQPAESGASAPEAMEETESAAQETGTQEETEPVEMKPETGTETETAAKSETETAAAGTETEEPGTEETKTEETKADESEEPGTEETKTEETEGSGTEETKTEETEEPGTEETKTEESEKETGQIKKRTEAELRDELNQRLAADGFVPSGYIEIGLEAEALGWEGMASYSLTESPVPAKYSALDNGQGTSVKNQGNWGSCWSFAAAAAAESQYKKMTGAEADMSESHLVNFFYNDDIKGPDGGLEGDAVIPSMTTKVNNGGNSMYTTFAMARWTGIADEKAHESLAYPSAEDTKKTTELNIPQEYAYTDLVHMQNAYWINKSDAAAVKQAVMDYGAVATYYKHDESHSSNYVDKSEYNGPAVYYNTVNYGDNHAIAIVGWDDGFDRNYFGHTALNHEVTQKDLPEKDGAWLIKNSWGTGYGDDGYFWMSYEEASLSDSMLAFAFEEADNYDHIYQYDGAAGVKYQSAETITAAAVYRSTGYQMIKAVGVGVASAATDYTVEVYTGVTDADDPQSGTLGARTEGTAAFQGYHTIELEKWVPVTEDETFSVVITLSNGKIEDSEGAAIFVDQSYANYVNTAAGKKKIIEFVAAANPGETFIKLGGNWQDAASGDAEAKVTYRIKAYTQDGEFAPPEENRILTPAMLKEIDAQEYSSTGSRPELEINYMGERLTRDTDFSVTYINNDKIADKAAPDAPRAVITGTGKYTGTIEQTFTIVPKKITDDMAGMPVHIYNGSIQDDIAVRDGETLLVKGTDYQISFDRQPCRAGTYAASVTGTGSYAGEIQVPVIITKAALADAVIQVPDSVEYTGAAIRPEVKVAVGGTQMASGNYTVSYKNNTSVGTAEITLTGKGDCQGKVVKTFAIRPKDIGTEVSATVAKAAYTGNRLQPAVTVKYGKKTLKKNKDYTITYANNVAAYTADKGQDIPAAAPKAVITGIGNYTGSFEKEFDILPKEIAESSISVQISYDDSGAGEARVRIQVFSGGTELPGAQAKAYHAGTGAEADEITPGGKYDVQVTLAGNYKVKGKESALKKNIVCKKDIAALNIRFADEKAAYTYNGKAQKPKLTVTDTDGNTVPSSCYTISYKNNVNAGARTAGNAGAPVPAAVVTGKGNYAGTRQLEFAIQKQPLNSLQIKPVKDYTYTGAAIIPAVKVQNGNKTLKAGEGKDYTCTYGNNTNVAYDGGNVKAAAYIEVRISDNYEIPGTGGDGGVAQTVYFKILPAKISSMSLSTAYYTGGETLPEKIVVKAGKLIVPPECYEAAAADNIEVSSKARLTVTARPGTNYTGSRTQKYRIAKQQLGTLALPVIPDQPWLGQPVEPAGYALRLSDNTELDAGQYTVSYKNNKKTGTASAVYKAVPDGRYKGSATVKFSIVSASVSQAIDYSAAQPVEKTYTGEEITLTDDELRLLAPVKNAAGGYPLPYTVTYSRNVDAGKAAVHLQGKDYLSGSRTVYFSITPKSAACFQIATGPRQLDYDNGTPVYLRLEEITDGVAVLRAGKDYTVSYINADKKGTACLAVTGTGNYTGTRYLYYSIN